MAKVALATLFLCLPLTGASGDWEWAGVFALEVGEVYTWSAARGEGGAYADSSMKLIICPTASADEAGLEAAEGPAEQLWGQVASNWTDALTGEDFLLGSTCIASNLKFDRDSWLSLFHLRAQSAGAYAFFCEHLPIEFENGFHYLREEDGHDVEPAFEESGGHGDEGEQGHGLGLAVGGAFLTTLPALLLIGVVGPGIEKFGIEGVSKFFPFTSGAIMGCAVFLLLPEALHLAGEGQDEVTGTWTWGVAILVGWLMGIVIHHIVELSVPGPLEHSKETGSAPELEANKDGAVAGGEADAGGSFQIAPDLEKKQSIDWAVASPVIVGDFIHGIVDGLVVGFAARLCSLSMTWSIIAATIGHEAPQEIGDFIILVVKAKMHWKWALLANFLSAQGAVIGALISYNMDVSSNLQGICLAFCGGVFLFISISELAPYMIHLRKKSGWDSLVTLASFSLGCTCMGLVLLDHQHCSAGGDGHEGHGH